MSIKRIKKKRKLSEEMNIDKDILKLELLYFQKHVLLEKKEKI